MTVFLSVFTLGVLLITLKDVNKPLITLHHCEACGLRLALHRGGQWQSFSVDSADSHSLTQPDPAAADADGAFSPRLVASSPLGHPARPDAGEPLRVKARYAHLKPRLVLRARKGGPWAPVTRVFDTSLGRGRDGALLYDVVSAAAPPMHPRPGSGQIAPWSPQQPHFQVNMHGDHAEPEAIVSVELFARASFGFCLYVPPAHPAPHGRQQWAAFPTRGPHSKAERVVLRQHTVSLRWASSEGGLLWLAMSLADEEGRKGSLCLLDDYDRLLLVVRDDSVVEMRFYVDLNPRMVGEIIASFVALKCQLWRVSQQDKTDEAERPSQLN